MAKKSRMGRVILGMRNVTSIKANKTKVNGQHGKSFILKYDKKAGSDRQIDSLRKQGKGFCYFVESKMQFRSLCSFTYSTIYENS